MATEFLACRLRRYAMWMPAGPAPTTPILDVLHLGPRTGWNGEPGSCYHGVAIRREI